MSEIKKEKALVVGGAGFLGSHVADALSDAGFEVSIYDRVQSNYLSKDQVMIEGDLLDENLLDQSIKGMDYVFNFSGISSLDLCAELPSEAIRNNVLGHTLLLEKCHKHAIKRVIFSSSVYVYSRFGSFYKITKQTCEDLTQEYFKKFGLSFTVLRFGSLYGERAQDWNGVQKYLLQAIQEKKIDYHGTGNEKREYIHVLDAAKMSVQILEERFKNQHIIITGNYMLSSRELLEMIREILGGEIEINITEKSSDHHYGITPYSFSPPQGMKLAPNPSIDMGEGVLKQIELLYNRITS